MPDNKRQTAGPPPLTDPRQRRSREALHAALLSLIERKPLDEITIKDVAAESGVGYTTFFRHYPSKEALLDGIATGLIDQLVDKSLKTLDCEDSRSSCLTLCQDVLDKRAVWTALLTGGAGAIMRDAYIRAASDVALERSVPQLTEWLPSELGVVHSCTAIITILTWWLKQEEPIPVSSIAEIMDRLVIQSLVSQTAPTGQTFGNPDS